MNYFISGIGGIGCSGLAQFLQHLGHTISGSDVSETEGVRICNKAGINVVLLQKIENISSDIDVLIYSEAVPETNAERMEAKRLGIPEKSYFEVLGELSADFFCIAMVGTHGKTTTTGLLFAALQACGAEPFVMMGAANNILNHGNFHAGDSGFLVQNKPVLLVEACEYRENFRFLHPNVVLLTNAEHDHNDYYKTNEDYMSAMQIFVNKADVLITHANEAGTAEMSANFDGNVLFAEDFEEQLTIPGEYNQKNAALANKCIHFLDLNVQKSVSGLKTYSGGSRRQQYLGEKNGVLVFDDYGHHPTEIALTVEAIKQRYGKDNSKIYLVFEPHQHARTKMFFNDFLKAFDMADFVALHPIYAARDTEEDKTFTIERFFVENDDYICVKSVENVQDFVKEAKKGDILLFMGAGVVDKLAKSFMDA